MFMLRLQPSENLKELHMMAEEVTAGLECERTDPQIPQRDLSPFARGNSGIRYAFTFASGGSGPTALVTSLAHGNEPGGLEAVVTLLENNVRPRIGRLSLAICNVA